MRDKKENSNELKRKQSGSNRRKAVSKSRGSQRGLDITQENKKRFAYAKGEDFMDTNAPGGVGKKN